MMYDDDGGDDKDERMQHCYRAESSQVDDRATCLSLSDMIVGAGARGQQAAQHPLTHARCESIHPPIPSGRIGGMCGGYV
jgi:hypothetical protein